MNLSIALIPTIILLLDRMTKWWAIKYLCRSPLSVLGNYITCLVTYNRGVSWSLLSYQDAFGFTAVTLLIMGVIGALMLHTIREYRNNKMLFGELLVLSGAVSNLYDRLVYGGVVDFILVQYGTWSFPVFNIADIAIVCGVLIMLYDTTIRK